MPTTDLCLQTESSASPVRALPGQDIAQHGCTTQREPRRPGIGARDRKPIDRLHPGHERHAKLRSQGPFWFLGNLHFFTISIGFVGPGMGLSAAWTALAGALGVMFGTVFMAFHGSQGPEMGLPQMIQSRAQFGYRGVALALAATLFVFVGFNVVNVSLIMGGLNLVFGLDPAAVAIAVVVAGGLLAIYGHDLMHRAFKWALMATLPLYALATVALALGVGHGPAAAPAYPGFSWVAFLTQFAISASYNISYAPYVSDYSRYLPRDTRRARLIAAIFLGRRCPAPG